LAKRVASQVAKFTNRTARGIPRLSNSTHRISSARHDRRMQDHKYREGYERARSEIEQSDPKTTPASDQNEE